MLDVSLCLFACAVVVVLSSHRTRLLFCLFFCVLLRMHVMCRVLDGVKAIGKSVRSYLSGASITTYPTMTISSTEFVIRNQDVSGSIKRDLVCQMMPRRYIPGIALFECGMYVLLLCVGPPAHLPLAEGTGSRGNHKTPPTPRLLEPSLGQCK